jgi:3-oxoacyl-[acyl-carrier-protein] synthase III
LAAELLHGFGYGVEPMNYLCWCHETAVDNAHTLPAFYMAYKLGWSGCLPIGLGQQGSLAFVSALELMGDFIEAEDQERCCLVAADCTKPPFTRSCFAGYPKGDAAAAAVLSAAKDTYKVIGTRFVPFCLPAAMHGMDAGGYEEAESRLTRSAARVAAEANGEGEAADWVIVQNLSRTFVQGIADSLGGTGIRLYERPKWSRANLLASDPLVSLHGLEQSGLLQKTARVTLLFASLDHGLAAVDLQKSD